MYLILKERKDWSSWKGNCFYQLNVEFIWKYSKFVVHEKFAICSIFFSQRDTKAWIIANFHMRIWIVNLDNTMLCCFISPKGMEIWSQFFLGHPIRWLHLIRYFWLFQTRLLTHFPIFNRVVVNTLEKSHKRSIFWEMWLD